MDTVNAAMSGAAQSVADAAQTVHASTPTSGTGTPLMNLATYLLYIECALIILLSVPVYVPYRKQLMEWIHYSPSLWKVRVIIFCINAFVAVLLGDTYLRLNRVTHQIAAIQAAHAQAVTGFPSAGATMAKAAGSLAGASTGSPIDASSHIANLNDLYTARFRGQRDFYILAFTLFCSTVLYQLHMLLIKMDKFRLQRDELRSKISVRKGSASPSSKSTGVVEGLSKSVKDASNKVVDKVDAILHLGAATAANGTAAIGAAPAEPGVAQKRTVYVTKEE
ncbi:hypothetical protein SpCBS45565_g07928 [Spizellomyces sp. 'palustris']|nr:hypothetical protein SpCBS45565_g07928 [Spizellomyces sp. 'palustris']